MSKQQTNNSYLDVKIFLREKYLNDKKNVLDCFSGESLIWNSIKKKYPDLNIVSVDKVGYKSNLRGDNRKYLLSLNLNRFDVIDLDAYGSPFPQLEIIFQKKWHGIIFCTFIQSFQGRLNNSLLLALGFTKAMIDKCPTLFSRFGFCKFKDYLSIRGIESVNYINKQNKYYIMFEIGGNE